MKLYNKTKNIVLAENVIVADSFFKRMKGLLGRKELNPGEGLILKPCNSVHTFFMRFPIDIVFVDKNNKVIKTVLSLRPFFLTGIYLSSHSCIELPSGTINSTSTVKGDIISLT